jgi:septal ring factor EnvC (AmiA/AmiB activator)
MARQGAFGRPRTILRALALAAGVLAGAVTVAQSVAERDAQLQAVRKKIGALEARLAGQVAKRDETAKALRAAELEAAEGARKLEQIRTQLRAQQGEQRSLATELERTTKSLASERAALARQVRVSYMNGREEIFKLVLSQESPASLGRMLVYYDYFNRARSERIAAVSGDLARLRELGARSDDVAAGLSALEAEQAAQVASVATARDERRALIAKLDAGIADSSASVAKLKADEKRLGDLVEQLKEVMAGFPIDTEEPFGKLRGKLAWPVQGRIAGDFGQPRDGGPMKWSGVLLEARQGTPVRAVYHGRVAFADWLPGLGLLIIVDHGDGYMSLYGHNEALLKEPGEWVEPGEAIAQVGDTGGQAQPALYFEIRRDGEPTNPHPWIAAKAPNR